MILYRSIHVEAFGPTNTLGTRVRVKDMRRGTVVWLPFDYSLGDIIGQAQAYLSTQGIASDGVALHDMGRGYTIVTQNFATPIKLAKS